MRLLILLAAAAVLFVGAPGLRAETADDFLKAYFLVQDGDAADKGGDTAKAVEKYSAALKILREIKRTSPDWNPNIIAYRTKYCSDRILKAGGRLEPEDSGASSASAPAAAATPTVEVSTPVNTVPKDAKPAAPEEAGATPRTSDRIADLERELERARQEISKLHREKGDLESRLKKAEDDLRSAGASGDERVQKLVQENDALKQRLADAESRLKGVGSNAGEIAAVRTELAKAQEAIEKLRGENEQLKTANAGLKGELEEVRGQLRTATASPASELAPEVLQTLQKENALLRAIVDRQYQEDSRRMQARDTLGKELEELGNRTEAIRRQIQVLATPLSPLSDDERTLLKTPAAIPREDPTKLSGTITSRKGASGDTTPKLSGDNALLASDAKRLFAKGDLEGAATKYEAILKTEPNNVFALSNLGVIRFRQDHIEEAEKALQGALAADPQDAFSLSVLGIVHYRQGRYDDAISVLTRAISINPNNHETHNYLGITYSQKGYQEAAEKELLKAIELKTDYADAHFNLAVVYASQTPPSLELARKHYRRAVELGMQKDPELEKLLAR
ncbi:MAG: tetratricopeptide repeat protein [Verrucomicrobiae bacterium]|nr:tetratricopeptide repeat protein [Verrucomicrobiae bacterium]